MATNIGIGTSVKTDLSKYKLPDNLKTATLSANQPKTGIANQATPTVGIGQATPVSLKVEPTISTSQLGKTTEPVKVVDNTNLVKNIQGTLDKAPTAKLNSQGLEGLLKIAGLKGGSRPDLVGVQLKDAINTLGIADKFSNPNLIVDMPQSNINSETGEIINPTQKDIDAYSKTTETVKVAPPKTALDYINDLDAEAQAMSGNIDNAYKDAGVQAKGEEVNRLTGELNALDTSETVRSIMTNINAQDLKDQYAEFEKGLIGQGAETARNRGIILGGKQDEINQKLQGLSSQEVRDLATYTLNRTNLAQQVQIAQGNYQIASDIAKESAESMKWAFTQKLALAQERNQITQQQATMAQQAFNNELDLAKEGMVAVPNANLQKLQADIASGKDKGKVITNPVNGKSYYQPESASLSTLEALQIEEKRLDIQKKLKSLGETVDLPTTTVNQIDKISSSFDSSPIVKQFNEVQNKKMGIDSIIESGVGGPADLALVFDFMKSLDPSSVVRETEYATASKSGNIFAGWAAKFNGYMKEEGGFLPENVKNEFQNLVGLKFDAVKKQYSNLRDEKARLINGKTGQSDGADYLVNYDFDQEAPETLQSYYNSLDDAKATALDEYQKNNGLSDDELWEVIQERGFNQVGGDTNSAILNNVVAKEDGTKGGQCGRFVNQITGLGLGDSYESKMAKMDSSITQPAPGMVFVMPYKDTGHTGFIVDIKGDKAIVKDSNYSLDEKVKTHEIALNKITGLRRV